MSHRSDFPLLSRTVHGKPLAYLDSAATTQKPQRVLDAILVYYVTSNANVHRGVHALSDASTRLFIEARQTVTRFFGALPHELIWTQNTTQAINAVAYGWGMHALQPADVIIVSLLDHHSNIVAWQELALARQATVVFCGITTEGLLDLADLAVQLKKYGSRVKMIAVPHVSNTLGTLVPVQDVVRLRTQHAPAARVLVDGAQAVGHIPVNFRQLGVDFYALSGHKMYGPMGSGGLLVREQLLKSGEMRPWLFGGGMIAEVHQDHTEFHADISERFVAGTPDVASAVGLAAACDYLTEIGRESIAEHDAQLMQYTMKMLKKVPQISIIGPSAEHRVGSVAFLYEGVHAHDVAQVLDSEGVAIRSGHHCTMPLHLSQGWIATNRASFGVYTTTADIDALERGLQKVAQVFGV